MSLDQRTIRFLVAASHALRSYQYGNSSPELAENIADEIDRFLTEGRKTKAREVVEGWPRGRSCSSPSYETLHSWMRLEGPAGEWSDEDQDNLCGEAVEDNIYHQQQQQMVDWWRAGLVLEHTTYARYDWWMYLVEEGEMGYREGLHSYLLPVLRKDGPRLNLWRGRVRV